MPTVTVLSCPVCGAPIQHGTSRCSYCGSMVVISFDHPLITPESVNQAVIGERIKVHRAAVRKDPHDETAHYGLGVAYFNLGLLEESSDELAQAARLMPENPNIQFQLAVVYHDLSERGDSSAESKSLDRLRRALLLQPTLADAHLLMAKIQRSKKQWPEMLSSWEKAATDRTDQVLDLLRGYIVERGQVLTQLHRRIGQTNQRITATPNSKQKKGPNTFRRTLGIFFLLFIASLFLTEVQAGLGALVFLGSFASLVVVPLVMRAQRRKAARQAVMIEPIRVGIPPMPTVPVLMAEARGLNRDIETAERTLKMQQATLSATSISPPDHPAQRNR